MQTNRKLPTSEDGYRTQTQLVQLRLADLQAPCCVLVVDDDGLVREHLKALLRMGGYEVLTAASGAEALHVMAAQDCHIVLTDWQMPDMDGLALCRQIRSKHAASYVYVVMLTVQSAQCDVLAGLAAGIDDYVLKGVSSEEILARLQVGRRITRLEQLLRHSTHENRRLTVTDPLTGARNRRYLVEYLSREVTRSRRYDRPLAILACDVDDLHDVNERLGREAGDTVLAEIVARASSCIRKELDWIARSAGDEFIVVLPDTNIQAASHVARKLREVLRRGPVSTFSGLVTPTMSIGVTALQASHELASDIGITALQANQELASVSVRELLRAAARGLDASKSGGKDQATIVSAVAENNLVPPVRIGVLDALN
jgi:two-component system cell cycle response regulator